MPLPFPRSVSRVVPSAAHALSPSAAAGFGALPTPSPSLLAACAQACLLRLPLGTPPVAYRPSFRAPVAGTLPRLRAVPPLRDHAPGVLLPLQLQQRDAWRRTLGRRGADGPRPPLRKGGVGGVRLWWADVGVARVGVGAVLRALPAPCCSCGDSRQGARGLRWGYALRWRRAGARDMVGRDRGVACWGRGLSSLRAWGPLRGRRGRVRGLGGGAVSSAGAGPWVDGSGLAGAAWVCPAGGPTGTAASISRHFSRSARVSPAYPGETGERDRGRWWRSSRWGEPSESDITVILVGMRRRQACPLHYLLVHLWCVVGSAVQCSAGGREGGEGGAGVALAPRGRGPVVIHRHWGGRGVSHVAHTSRHSSKSGAGFRALGPRGSSGGAEGSRTRWTSVTAVTSCVRRKACTPSCATGAGRGVGARALPRTGGWE